MKLYNFEEISHILEREEEKLLWQFLSSKKIKLKDIRFMFKGCSIGTAIFVTSISGRELIDITDYYSW